jgi:hypothetical protein
MVVAKVTTASENSMVEHLQQTVVCDIRYIALIYMQKQTQLFRELPAFIRILHLLLITKTYHWILF